MQCICEVKKLKKIKGRMDESILVCVSYGPNGKRLINRGYKLASMLDCPLYILTVESMPHDEFDAEKADYIEEWRQLADEIDADEFIVRDNEKRPSAKAIAEVVNKYNITQVIIGQSAKTRWEHLTKGSFIDALLKEMTFTDIHIVSVDRTIKSAEDALFDKGLRYYLVQEKDGFKLCAHCPGEFIHEGIFYKEVGTDFNNGIFKFIYHGKPYELKTVENKIKYPEQVPVPKKHEKR